MAATLFIIQVALYLGAPGVEGLFLTRYGPEALPFMYIAVGIAVPATVVATTIAMARMRRRTIYRGIPILIAASLPISRVVLVASPYWFYPVLYVHMNLVSTLGAFFCWGIAGSICDTREAKRLFPFFAAGGILGSSVGGLLTPLVVSLVGAPNLILIWGIMVGAASVLADALRGRGVTTRRLAESILSVYSNMRSIKDPQPLVAFSDDCLRRLDEHRTIAGRIQSMRDDESIRPARLSSTSAAVEEAARRLARWAIWARALAAGRYDHLVVEGLASDNPEALVNDIELLGDPWLTACALHEFGDSLPRTGIDRFRRSDRTMIADAAERAATGGDAMRDTESMSLMERMLFLKQTPILRVSNPTRSKASPRSATSRSSSPARCSTKKVPPPTACTSLCPDRCASCGTRNR